MLQAWQQFIDGQAPGSEVSPIILESWQRCRAFAIDVANTNLRRVSYGELRERLQRNDALLRAATVHLQWALASMHPIAPAVIILTDPAGVIIESVGNAHKMMATFGLVPGYDWSEKVMGTNGIGTALSFGGPVAVVGVEHYARAWHNSACVGAPIKGANEEFLGAVVICTTAADGDPSRLVLVSFLAHVIAREVMSVPGDLSTFAGPDVLARSTAVGSSASSDQVLRHAQDLHAMADTLLDATRPHPWDPQPRAPVLATLRTVAGLLPGIVVATDDIAECLVPASDSRLKLALVHLLSLAKAGSARGCARRREESFRAGRPAARECGSDVPRSRCWLARGPGGPRARALGRPRVGAFVRRRVRSGARKQCALHRAAASAGGRCAGHRTRLVTVHDQRA